jgi:hypothetical protein
VASSQSWVLIPSAFQRRGVHHSSSRQQLHILLDEVWLNLFFLMDALEPKILEIQRKYRITLHILKTYQISRVED